MVNETVVSRRGLLRGAGAAVVAAAAGRTTATRADDDARVAADARAFIDRCRRDDGSYAPAPDPDYKGNSDTGLSDLAAVTYAATLAKTMGWRLHDVERSIGFIHDHQQPDGSYRSRGGSWDPGADLAVLYSTVQAVVALRALGARPRIDPAPTMDRFFVNDAHAKLPWYTTSFFPLFFAALGRPFPEKFDRPLRERQTSSQAEDGYLGDHVAAAFHMAHYFRLVGQPTPKARQMVARVLRDQKADGGWNIKQPDSDVHAGFDAVFILHQLGGDDAAARDAIAKAAAWALACRNADGGFGHFPGWHSDVDAVYFQLGTLIQAGRLPGAKLDLDDGHTLSWGHAMQPGRNYVNG
jgi:geranylgeranyl transferase type-2 subunit beta